MELKKVNIKDIKPARYNPRKISKKDFEKLKTNIKEFGFIQPLIVNKDMTLIGGHQRLKVLLDLGYKETDVIIVNLNKEKEKSLNISLNKISGEWDNNKLVDILKTLDKEELDLSGFDKIEVDKLTNEKFFLEKEFNEHIETKNVCPKCKYKW